MRKLLNLFALGVTLGLLAACAQLGVRGDTVAYACEDVGALFAYGIEARLEGYAAPRIEAALLARGASPLEATLLTAQIMAQTMPVLTEHKARFVADASRIMDAACLSAGGLEAFVGEVEVRPVPKT